MTGKSSGTLRPCRLLVSLSPSDGYIQVTLLGRRLLVEWGLRTSPGPHFSATAAMDGLTTSYEGSLKLTKSQS